MTNYSVVISENFTISPHFYWSPTLQPPLCEKDDVSDDLDNAFDCEDVIYCRSGEVAREKGTRWRIRLKEGIANFNGKDILFKECSSDLLDF